MAAIGHFNQEDFQTAVNVAVETRMNAGNTYISFISSLYMVIIYTFVFLYLSVLHGQTLFERQQQQLLDQRLKSHAESMVCQ